MNAFSIRWSFVAAAVAALVTAGCDSPPPAVGALDVTPDRVELPYPGAAPVELSWRMDDDLGAVEGDLRVYVHLLDDRGGLARTFDHPFPGEWTPGGSATYALELYQSALAPPLTEGDYELSIGLYDAGDGRWRVSTGAEEEPPVAAATVVATGAPADFPMFYFSPDWFASEGGTDRQVLARRWLGESGTLKVSGIRRPGTLSMMLGLPTDEAEVDELVLDEGAADLAVTAVPTCGEPVTVTGAGSNPVEIPIAAGPDGTVPEECEIGFEANFYLISLETLARRTLALEMLAWSYDD